MQVSIIIINYNTYNYTCNCIQSVIDKTKGIQYEIILVDNASAECNADLFKEKFPNIILIKSNKNLGFAGGNNLGLQFAKGEYILLLNSDTLLVENSVLFIYEKTKNINNLGAATVKLIYPDGTIQQAAQKFPSVKQHFLVASRLYKIFKKSYQKRVMNYDYTTDFSCDWVWGTFFFFKKKNLEVMQGKLAETYFMYFEDVEWCYNFKKAGLKNYYFAESKIIHLVGKSSTGSYKTKLIRNNHMQFIRSKYGIISFLTEIALSKWDNLERKIRTKQTN